MRTVLAYLIVALMGQLASGCGDGAAVDDSSPSGGAPSTGGISPSDGGMSPSTAAGGTKDDIVVPAPRDDGTLAQARCVAPWDMDFEFNDQYIVLELPGPLEVGQVFYIKTKDPVPAATYTVYDIPKGCRLPQDQLGSTEVTTEQMLCLALTLENPESEPTEDVLLHVGQGAFIDTGFLLAEDCP